MTRTRPGAAEPRSPRRRPQDPEASKPGAPEAGASKPGTAGPGTSVPVRVRPGAGRTRVGGCHAGPHGPALIVAVGAPAVDGKATEAVRKALADALGVRPAEVSLRLGATSRDKVFTVTAARTGWEQRLTDLRDNG